MAFLKEDLGAYLREQRTSARLTLRQLAELAEVSNPYLSQIERGLKRPSAEILQSLARGLRVSAESLYIRAGILEERDDEQVGVEAAILGDHVLSERQKRVLLEIYETFRAESSRPDGEPASGGSDAVSGTDLDEARSAAPTKTPTRAATKVAKKAAKRTAKRAATTTSRGAGRAKAGEPAAQRQPAGARAASTRAAAARTAARPAARTAVRTSPATTGTTTRTTTPEESR